MALLKAPLLTYLKGKPTFRKRVPKALLGHPQLPATFIKQALAADPADHVALFRELQEVTQKVELFLRALESVNTGTIRRQELVELAQRRLKRLGLKAGDLDPENPSMTYQDYDLVRDGVDAHSIIEDGKRGDPVAEMMWELLHKPSLVKREHTYAAVWKHYRDLRLLDAPDRDRKRIQKRWDRFCEIAQGTLLTSEGVNQALREFVHQREQESVTGSTIVRELGQPILSALNLYLEDHADLELFIRKPKVSVEPPKQRVALDTGPHRALFRKILGMPDSWAKLALLLQWQLPVINSELMNLRREDVVRDGPVVYFRVTAGKTRDRVRVQPLVVEADTVLALMDTLAEPDNPFVMPGRVRATNESNWSHQLNTELQKLSGRKDLTSYCGRHTWASCARRAAVPQHFIDSIGGWSTVNNKGVGYGRGADEFADNLLATKRSQRKVVGHLVSAEEAGSNVVSL